MSVTKQLYQLQEIDLELESREQALRQLASQLGENEVIIRLRNKRTQEQGRLEELRRQQRSLEWEIDDLTSKLATADEKLYSGRIRNPKELTSLHTDVEGMKAKRAQLEDKVLESMEQVESTTKSVAAVTGELKASEAKWQSQQRELSANLEQVKSVLADLQKKRQLLTTEIEFQVVEVYHELKKQKGTAVAKVEQGVCRGCRISLPVTELLRTRSGELVRCSSCGRILFLA